MSGPDEGWTAKVTSWANARSDIKALVQIGSRVQEGAAVDEWSDHDYQLITSDPQRYGSGAFARELGPCWAFGCDHAFGNVVKVTAVFEGGLEADFVILSHAKLALATTALAWPSTEALWPRSLVAGVRDLRIVAAPGWKVIKGGATWERRYSRIKPYLPVMDQAEFASVCGVFWVQLVWAAKKAQRGECIASQRAFHRTLVENSLRMQREEALLAGKKAYPLGRRAEQWLTPAQRIGRSMPTQAERDVLLTAIRLIAEEFIGFSASVAAKRGFASENYTRIVAWLAQLDHSRGSSRTLG